MAARDLRGSSIRWWRPDVLDGGSDARAAALASDIRMVREAQAYRLMEQQFHAMLFGDLPLLGFEPHQYARTSADFAEALSLNIVQMLCRAANARITKGKPKPSFVTTGADYLQQQKARKADKYLQGLFYENSAYALGRTGQLHATVWGTGHLKHWIDWTGSEKGGPKICSEVRYPFSIVVDDAEAQNPQNLRTMGEEVYTDRYKLAHYADQVQQSVGLPAGYDHGERSLKQRVLDMTPGNDAGRDIHLPTTADMVRVYEGWHLPSGFGSGDGRHTISTGSFCILDEPWERNRFPFSRVNWCDPLMGYNGVGIAKLLTGIQIEINEILTQLSQGYHLIRGMWTIDRASGVQASHINNDLDRIIEYGRSRHGPAVHRPAEHHHPGNLQPTDPVR